MVSIESLWQALYAKYWNQIYPKQFKSFGKNSVVNKPLRLHGIENITIGDHVRINYKAYLAASPKTGFEHAELIIDSGSIIGNFNHIYATKSIYIGKNVLTADKIYISDNLHTYENIHIPVMHQPIKQINEVSIGDGTWIGENACIIGVKIGKNCVIGANSVVTKDIPDFSVAVGIPAIIIKRFNLVKNAWLKTTPDGSFV